MRWRRARSARHRGSPDLHPHPRDDGPDRRHDRRALGGTPDARARGLPSSRRGGMARPEHRPPRGRDARVRIDRAGDPARRAPARGREVADRLPPVGLDPSPRLPMYIAALSPAMLRLAGEIADGVMLWLCTPRYIEEVVIPEVSTGLERAGQIARGLRRRGGGAGRPHRGSRERPGAMRKDLIPYFGLPFYRAMIERTGFGADIAAYDAAAGDLEAMAGAISEGFLEELVATAIRTGSARRSSATARPARARPVSARSRGPTSRPPCGPDRRVTSLLVALRGDARSARRRAAETKSPPGSLKDQSR